MSTPEAGAPDEKLDELRKAVVAGTYQPDLEAVAAAVLRHWSGEVSADAWLKSANQEVGDPDESAEARSDTSSF
ncbi:MAG: flagellar biosynthesis anti-sigma factor FlgM [Acidimicrobiia bacterium]